MSDVDDHDLDFDEDDEIDDYFLKSKNPFEDSQAKAPAYMIYKGSDSENEKSSTTDADMSSPHSTVFTEENDDDVASMRQLSVQAPDDPVEQTEENNAHVASTIFHPSVQMLANPTDQPELMYESPAKYQNPPSSTPGALERFEELLKKVPFLKIPCYFGFSRCVDLMSTAMDIDQTCQRVTYKTENDTVILTSKEKVFAYLLEKNIELPISCFTFEPCINPHDQYFKDCWETMTVKEDLAEGQERHPIQVICHKSKEKSAGRLVSYVKDCFIDDKLKVPREHDDEFFVCCDCPNDCEDKLNCPCFLKTLDNCSESTREAVGDKNIGYDFQRLHRPYLSGIFECNRMCKCRKLTCLNRVVQNGAVYKLQLFMTDLKGWGVRTLQDIPKGSFICTYSGKIVSGQYAEKVSANWNGGKWRYLSELRVGEEEKEGFEAEVVEPVPKEKDAEEGNFEDAEWDDDDENDKNEIMENVPAVPGTITGDEWNEFMSTNTPSPEEQQRPSSPATSCFITPSVFLRDDDDEEEQSNPEPQPCSSRTAMAQVKEEAVADVIPVPPINDRELRSAGCFETPEDFELLPKPWPKGRSMDDIKLLCRLNLESKKLSEICIAPNRRGNRTPKVTQYMFLEDRINQQAEEKRFADMKREREKRSRERRKLNERLANSTRLSSQYLTENFVKSVKLSGEESSNENFIPGRLAKCANAMVRKARAMLKSLKKRSATEPDRNSVKIKGTRRRRKPFFHSKRKLNVPLLPAVHPLLNCDFNVDGLERGNIGRYFNHSCDPNTFPQYVYVTSHDLRLPQIALFAARNIKAGEELGWDYKYESVEEEKDKRDDQQQQQQQNDHVQDQNKTQEGDVPARVATRHIKRSLTRNAGGPRNKLTRLYCHCGADNCTNRIC